MMANGLLTCGQLAAALPVGRRLVSANARYKAAISFHQAFECCSCGDHRRKPVRVDKCLASSRGDRACELFVLACPMRIVTEIVAKRQRLSLLAPVVTGEGRTRI